MMISTQRVFTKEEIKGRVQSALETLQGKGVSAELIAVKLHMSYNSVKNWRTGRRVPKIPVIRQMESEFGIKILADAV